MEDYDYCIKQINVLNKRIDELNDIETLKYEMALLQLLEQFVMQKEIKWRPMNKSISAFVKKYSDSDIKSEFYNYTPWLSSKISG